VALLDEEPRIRSFWTVACYGVARRAALFGVGNSQGQLTVPVRENEKARVMELGQVSSTAADGSMGKNEANRYTY